MPGKKFGFLALTFILMSAVVVPALLTDIAYAECSVLNSVTAVQLFHNPNDYRWQGSWDPRLDFDWQTRYGTYRVSSCDVIDTGRSAARDTDRSAARDTDRSAARDCDRRGSVSGYRCDLWGCDWTRDRDCTTCGVR
jgi:hypothetical protein